MLNEILEKIVSNHPMHARWLNTLSYLENCGARKIAACQHPTMVPHEMLKHAAEEFRHAYYLKQQIRKLPVPFLSTYRTDLLMGGFSTLRYLDRLELNIVRCLKENRRYQRLELRSAAYLWVTYAIEKRALELYSIYHHVLNSTGSPITVRSLIAEEGQHLRDMEKELNIESHWKTIDSRIHILESDLFNHWITYLLSSVCSVK